MTFKSTHYDYLVKMLLIGDSGVGKSSLLLQYTDDTFTDDFISTIGIDFRIKTINTNDKKIKLQIWDTAGQERFRTITSAYYRGAMGIFIVYDVADLKTFQNIKYWVKNVKENAPDDIHLMLIGNKCDIKNREVSFEMGKALADELNIKFIETSAKTNVNIDEMYTSMIDDVLKYMDKTYKNTISEKNIKLDKNNTNTHNKSKSCC